MTMQTTRDILNIAASPAPSINIFRSSDRYEIVSSLPGVVEDDVIVGIIDGVLTLGAKSVSEIERNFGDILSVEHRAHLIEQSFALPEDVDEDNLAVMFGDQTVKVVIGRKAG